jgi:hypothetical protein
MSEEVSLMSDTLLDYYRSTGLSTHFLGSQSQQLSNLNLSLSGS